MNETLQSFKKDILRLYPELTTQAWEAFQSKVEIVSYRKGETIFPETEVCNHVLFIAKGIAASENQTADHFGITRFFKPNGLCSNVISLFYGELNNDRLFAISQVEGVRMTKELFLDHYLHSPDLGQYFRRKILSVILEDKHYISLKTLPRVEQQLTYLQEHFPAILLDTPWKYIANFLGVTPAWLSRVLKKGS